MRRWKEWLLLTGGAVVTAALCGAVYVCFWVDSPDRRNYERVQVGMSVDEVQVILGPGTPVNQSEVPGIVVAVNPADADASQEAARRRGGSPPTARDYPTRIKPVVEGDYILKWVNSQTGERILVAFKDGIVSEKDYWNPNYF